jgi:hypothetical protein
MKRLCFYLFIIAGILFLAGCTPRGLLYTHIRTPLDINMSQTPADGKNNHGDLKHIPFYVDVMWDSNAIGDIAKQNGIETVYFADLETLRILIFWNQYTVHVYGK